VATKMKRAFKAMPSLKPWQQAVLLLCVPFVIQYLYKRVLTVLAIDPTNIGARLAMNVVKSYSFGEDEFYSADGCSEATAEKRRKGFKQLAARFSLTPGGKMEAVEKDLADGLSDIRFTDTNRVPFQFQTVVRKHLKVASVVMASNVSNLATLLEYKSCLGYVK